MNTIEDISLIQLLSAYIFIIILLFIVKRKGISREREILIASIRMTFQLILVGYILTYVFKHSNPWLTIIIILLMELFAVYNIFKRSKETISIELKWYITISLFIGTIATILYFDFVVINFMPWYDPRYFIPISGMIIGNAMTGINLGVNTLIEGMKSKRHLVESALMLGATPKEASKTIVNQAFDAAILPTINSMVGMGIVFLPGMMTGVILSGADPLVSIKYQIAIVLGITGSVSLSVFLFIQFGYKTFFTNRAQLK
ncbi:ABC transporter permease [Cytobacillus sp. IB215665]|uniref:ABC transporter permease n=1 Tax=Cytobacillus sp. IB215665 TaxID=3097357 RepID=UPI002A0B4882|nr:iron export ABC transporter permease subunit FetB [Cytobacillus sp. IB215665]MDX8366662.1 iron export ABC transporter permease subunit FetB [Cytobacillus sp. IB215665]